MIIISRQVLLGMLKLGDFTALLSASQQLQNRITTFFDSFRQAYEHSLYIEKYRDFIDKTPTSNTGSFIFDSEKITIDMHNVCFSYCNSSSNAINDVSLHIQAGEVVAFVGPNGAGKSSLVKLLSRLYVPSSGEILFNNIPYQQYEIDSFRDVLGYVFQETKVFAASIIENVLMRKIMDRQRDESLVSSALKHVGLYERFCVLPNGLYTHLSNEFNNEGINLSGGELQRLAIARVLVRKCKLIIFDEPFSSLDVDSEEQILECILSLPEHPTVILITHKLNNLQKTDKIYYLDSGEIMEYGTFSELIKRDTFFSKC